MQPEFELVLERYLDGPDGATVGWLAHYGGGRAMWCGELTRAAFLSQPKDVREGLRDDLGWFIIDYDPAASTQALHVLGKAACERTALDLVTLLVRGRLAAEASPAACRHAHPIVAPAPAMGFSCPKALRPEIAAAL